MTSSTRQRHSIAIVTVSCNEVVPILLSYKLKRKLTWHQRQLVSTDTKVQSWQRSACSPLVSGAITQLCSC